MKKNKQTKKKSRKTTLHRRLLLFFLSVSIFLIVSFSLTLSLFGINGGEENSVKNHISTELSIIAEEINKNFGLTSLRGIEIAEETVKLGEEFFQSRNISPSELSSHPEMIEPLLSRFMPTLVNTIKNEYCGGVFVILDASVTENKSENGNRKSGIFIKKTQPTSTDSVGVDLHFLRGPAKIARENNIMLLGQWIMEFDISGQDFFKKTIDTAKNNPQLPISRLYYWSGRITLKGNSESGFLLCVPMRGSDGTVFGICGIEISDRLFKENYSPEGGTYNNIFTAMAPRNGSDLITSEGLIAGNLYLTGTRWEHNLEFTEKNNGVVYFSNKNGSFGGLTEEIILYPSNSAYKDSESWSIAVLLDKQELTSAINGNLFYFIITAVTLILFSIVISYFISKRYLRPISEAFHSIKHESHEERNSTNYHEISDLFDFLAEKDKKYEDHIKQKEEDSLKLRSEYEKTQLELSRLAYSRKQEVDPLLYQQFLDNLSTLTPTERTVFDLYIEGKHASEIMKILGIKENTLKYHNKNIYSKLGVSSRKELLRYAAIMNREQ
ncbi:MAG: helix-turn-helix transcriptional regulator [Ruminococcaceae bacterium]|nr:helix-turn-helix transcriptional regulator [Oscillospiraceae bacterium]